MENNLETRFTIAYKHQNPSIQTGFQMVIGVVRFGEMRTRVSRTASTLLYRSRSDGQHHLSAWSSLLFIYQKLVILKGWRWLTNLLW